MADLRYGIKMDKTIKPFFLDTGARASCGGNGCREQDHRGIMDLEGNCGEWLRIKMGTERGPFVCAMAAPEIGSLLLEGLRHFPACSDLKY